MAPFRWWGQILVQTLKHESTLPSINNSGWYWWRCNGVKNIFSPLLGTLCTNLAAQVPIARGTSNRTDHHVLHNIYMTYSHQILSVLKDLFVSLLTSLRSTKTNLQLHSCGLHQWHRHTFQWSRSTVIISVTLSTTHTLPNCSSCSNTAVYYKRNGNVWYSTPSGTEWWMCKAASWSKTLADF